MDGGDEQIASGPRMVEGGEWAGWQEWRGTDAFEDLEPAPGHRVMGAAPLFHGDDVVPIAPHDERRHGGREIQPVGRAHALAADVQHCPQRVYERLPSAGI